MADGLSRADPQKPKHMHGAAAHHDSNRDIDSDTRQEFLFLYTDASANIRFAKAQQWRTLIYFSALCVGVVAVGVWLRWGDVSLVRFLFYLVWVFSLATVGTILMLQSWQSSEAKKQAFMRAHFDELTRSALAQKSRFTSDVHRYIMLGFMLFYVEMATFAVSRMLWPHFQQTLWQSALRVRLLHAVSSVFQPRSEAMEAMIYTGSYAESDSAQLKSNAPQKLGIASMSGFTTAFNGVYSSKIEEENASTGSAAAASVSNADTGQSAVVTALLDYLHKTPEERYFDAILKDKGLTQEQYDALPPKEKAALREEIMEEVRERMIADAARKELENQGA